MAERKLRDGDEWWEGMILVGGESKVEFILEGDPTGEVAYEIPGLTEGHWLWDCAFLNGNSIVFGFTNALFRFELDSKTLHPSLPGGSNIRGLDVIDERWIVAGQNGKDARVWNCNANSRFDATLNHAAATHVADVKFLPFQNSILSLGYGGPLKLWDAKTFAPKNPPEVPGCNAQWSRIAVCEAADVAAIANGNAVKLFDFRQSTFVEGLEIGCDDHIPQGMAFMGTSEQFLVVGCQGGHVLMFDRRNPDHAVLAKAIPDQDHIYASPVVSLWGDNFLVGGNKGVTKTFRMSDGKEQCTWTRDKPLYSLTNLSLSCPLLRALSLPEEPGNRLMDNSLVPNTRDFTIKFPSSDRGGKVLKCWKSLIADSETIDLVRQDHIDVQWDLDVEQEVFDRLLLGSDETIPTARLLDYYSLFVELGMTARSYLICEQIPKLRHSKASIVLQLCRESLERYGDQEANRPSPMLEVEDGEEEQEEEEGEGEVEIESMQFATPFTHYLMNCLKSWKERYLRRNRKLRREFAKIYGDVDAFEIRPPDEWEGGAPPLVKNQLQLFHRNAFSLYESDTLSDITLISNDGKKFKVHFPILVARLKFFQQLVNLDVEQFAEMESLRDSLRDSKEIRMVFLMEDDVRSLLEFAYCLTLSTVDYGVLFSLLKFADKYMQFDLRHLVIRNLSRAAQRCETDGSAEVCLSRSCYVLESGRLGSGDEEDEMNPDLKALVLHNVVRNTSLDREQVMHLIGRSGEVHQMNLMRREIGGVREENEKLKQENGDLRGKVEDLRKLTGEILKRLDDLERREE